MAKAGMNKQSKSAFGQERGSLVLLSFNQTGFSGYFKGPQPHCSTHRPAPPAVQNTLFLLIPAPPEGFWEKYEHCLCRLLREVSEWETGKGHLPKTRKEVVYDSVQLAGVGLSWGWGWWGQWVTGLACISDLCDRGLSFVTSENMQLGSGRDSGIRVFFIRPWNSPFGRG